MSAAQRLVSALIALVWLAGCTPATSSPTPPTPAAPTTAANPTAAPAVAPTTAPAPAQPTGLSRPASPVSGEVVVFAASSLTDVFQDMATAFQVANPNAKLTFNFGASSQLATQLGQGAHADAFASADQTQMDAAKKSDAIAGPDTVFARNQLVLITPRANLKHIISVKDLANDGVKFVTAQPSVPIGAYTAQLLDNASSDPAFGSDFKNNVEANTVSKEDNVRQVVSKVQLGEADAAIVYSTDATPQVRDQLNIIPVPDALQTLATYPIAVAKGANSAGGEAFTNYVLGPDGQATLAKWGFLPPTASAPTTAAAQPAAAPATPPPPAAAAKPAAAAASAPAAAPVPAVASMTFSPDVAIEGLVGTPKSLTFEDLKALPAETVNVSFQSAPPSRAMAMPRAVSSPGSATSSR